MQSTRLIESYASVLRDDLKTNPVYVGMTDIITKSREISFKESATLNTMARMILTSLDVSFVPNPYDHTKSIDLRSKDGEDVLHQALGFTFTTAKEAEGNPHWIEIDEKSPELGVNPCAIKTLMSITGKSDIASMYEVLGDLFPIPYKTCEYSRLTPKAVEYLLSLGMPRPDTVRAFMDELNYKASLCEHGNFEEVVSFSLNNRPTCIYYGFRNGSFYGFRYVSGGEGNEFTWVRKSDYKPESNSYYENLDCDDNDRIFDTRAFIVNLWAARMAKTFECTSEPDECRKYIGSVCGKYKPNFSSYRYVKITPEGELQYEEAKRIINTARKDAEYRKSVWFTRAYYARRGNDKNIVLCSASIHHRKCAEVTGTPQITVYT